MTDVSAAALLENVESVPYQTITHWLSRLPKEDINRASSLKSPLRKRQFVIGRTILSQLIFDRLGVQCNISTRSNKQPYVSEPKLFCSISHSGTALFVGYSTIAPFGLDIEHHKPRAFKRLTQHAFHTSEYEALLDLNEEEHMLWFYSCWTRKEAYSKALGTGLTQSILSQPALTHAPPKNNIAVQQFQQFTISTIHLNPAPVPLFTVHPQKGSTKVCFKLAI